jgi:hypothetical protein
VILGSSASACMANRDAFISEQLLQLRGYEMDGVPYGGLASRLVSTVPIQTQFDSFANRVIAATGSRYLPIYRMADGEFIFATGVRHADPRGGLLSLPRRAAAAMIRTAFPCRQATCWGENYSPAERRVGLANLAAGLRLVARDGILAPYFMRRPDRWAEQYFYPMCSFLDACGVVLTKDNYVPFYFVYALLAGRYRRRLFERRRVLVVTHVSAERMRRIAEGLRGEGAAAVEFVAISPDKSLLDTVRVPTGHGCTVALVAAGIGSINVISQLEGFPGPCIDAGAAVNAYCVPGVRDERPFLRLNA